MEIINIPSVLINQIFFKQTEAVFIMDLQLDKPMGDKINFCKFNVFAKYKVKILLLWNIYNCVQICQCKWLIII